MFLKLLIVLFILCLFFKVNQFSESKHLNKSKATSHFLEELKSKSGDNFGNSGDNESTSISKFEILKSILNFSKAKNAWEQLERMDLVEKKNKDFVKPLMEAQIERKRDREFLF